VYSAIVYTNGTRVLLPYTPENKIMIMRGKRIFQEKNCIACHQLYGLGGYLGPELTTAWSDKHRGPEYMRAILRSGGSRMPDFGFTDKEINSLLYYLRYVDSTAVTYKITQ